MFDNFLPRLRDNVVCVCVVRTSVCLRYLRQKLTHTAHTTTTEHRRS
jgi:hypothetical protein